jgi:hypothetical protein
MEAYQSQITRCPGAPRDGNVSLALRELAFGSDWGRERRFLLPLLAAVGIGIGCFGCTQPVAGYDASVVEDARSLRKQVDALFFDMRHAQIAADKAQIAADENPKSATAQKASATALQALLFSNFQKQWEDILDDADDLQGTICNIPNNEDVCTVAKQLYGMLYRTEQTHEAGPLALKTQEIDVDQIRDQIGLLIHDESYKQLASEPGSSGAASSGGVPNASSGKSGSRIGGAKQPSISSSQ